VVLLYRQDSVEDLMSTTICQQCGKFVPEDCECGNFVEALNCRFELLPVIVPDELFDASEEED